jgi:hypothetical protein
MTRSPVLMVYRASSTRSFVARSAGVGGDHGHGRPRFQVALTGDVWIYGSPE